MQVLESLFCAVASVVYIEINIAMRQHRSDCAMTAVTHCALYHLAINLTSVAYIELSLVGSE